MKGLIFLLCWLMVCAMGAVVWGLEGDAELLRLVADEYERNQEGLHTWGGTITTEEHCWMNRGSSESSDEVADSWTASGSFRGEMLVDMDTGMRWWNNYVEEATPGASGNEEHRAGWYRGMMREDADYAMHYEAAEARPRMLEISAKGEMNGTELRGAGGFLGFDPFYTWHHVMGGLIVPGSGSARYAYERADEMEGVRVYREGDRVTLDLGSSAELSETSLMDRMVFDLAQGGNVVELERTEGVFESRLEAEYEEMEGVFVLKGITLDSTFREEGTNGEAHLRLTVETNMVNEPVAEEEWGLDRIGLRLGDNILDRRTNTMFYDWNGTSDFSGMRSEAWEERSCCGSCCGMRSSRGQKDVCDQ
ncbi:MAG: hypothetical protein JW936_04730 [Sedimentisphaerales bacterium]|nr:hypothetical protein [Sedimentisphaerales bacterium]